jgi:hypothetical protein
MSCLPTRILVLALGVAFVSAAPAPADAKKARHPHKQAVAAHRTKAHRAKPATPGCRGASQFPCEVYFGDRYLGTDPDPFIRSQILRTYGHSAF